MNATQRKHLVDALEARFAQHMPRHAGVAWDEVHERLHAHPAKLQALFEMERTGGEPDVIGSVGDDGGFRFCDCVAESPLGRRSLCYDGEAWRSRKENKPEGNVIDMAAAIGIALLDEAQYRHLQAFGEFDVKTSSWIATPPDVRQLGGSLFCDRRYDRVFVYHNGAQSYYAARGFRGVLQL